MIELETVIRFNDIKENELREIGDRFKVDEERAKYLVEERKLCVVVKIEKEDKPLAEIIEDVKEEAKEKTTVEQKIDNITVETNDTKVVIENKETTKEDKPKTTTKKKAAKKINLKQLLRRK